MKKLSLLLVLLFTLSANTNAQSSLPTPLDPVIDGWYDYTGGFSHLMFTLGQTLMTNEPVADDYSIEKEFDVDSAYYGDYTILSREYVTYSIFTDFDEIFVFTPEEYPNDADELNMPTTDIPFNHEGFEFGMWECHFPHHSNITEGMAPFFQWRIGIRTNYRVGDQASYSNIVYYEIGPKPVTMLGDVNNDGAVNITDVTALINYLLSHDALGINKFNADVDDTNSVNITDVTALINYLLSKQWPS